MGALLKQEGFNMCGFGSTDLHKKNMCDVVPRNGGTMFGVGTKTAAAKQEFFRWTMILCCTCAIPPTHPKKI